MLSHDDFEWAYSEMSEGQMQHMANRIYKYNGIYAQALTKLLKVPSNPPEKTYRIGDTFGDENSREYILVSDGAGGILLVNRITGFPYTESQEVKSINTVTVKELKAAGPISGIWRDGHKVY